MGDGFLCNVSMSFSFSFFFFFSFSFSFSSLFLFFFFFLFFFLSPFPFLFSSFLFFFHFLFFFPICDMATVWYDVRSPSPLRAEMMENSNVCIFGIVIVTLEQREVQNSYYPWTSAHTKPPSLSPPSYSKAVPLASDFLPPLFPTEVLYSPRQGFSAYPQVVKRPL